MPHLTLDERERLAYIQGQTDTASLLAVLADNVGSMNDTPIADIRNVVAQFEAGEPAMFCMVQIRRILDAIEHEPPYARVNLNGIYDDQY